MALGKTVFIKKLTDGGVGLFLQDVDGVLPSRWFQMDSKMPRIGVPENFALSILVDTVLQKMLARHYFEVEDMLGLIKIAEARGFVSPSADEVKVLTEPKMDKLLIVAILKGGKEDKLRALFASADRKRALEIVTEKVKELPIETIERIENILGMAITEE